jgi:AraC family transcriptional regulator of adaptative response/methylated-DNA-[protein]-cysteine methyltransferase
MMDTLLEQMQDYQRIEQVIKYLQANFKQQPDLEEIADSVHLSKYHFQRIFKRWAGVTPAQFLHYLTLEYAKQRLRESNSIFDTSLDAGLSSPSRLHDMFITFEAVTPGEYKAYGKDLEIFYGFHASPFGECFVSVTQRGICALRFVADKDREAVLTQVQQEWPEAVFLEAPQRTENVIEQIFGAVQVDAKRGLHLVLKGTNFQVQVWQALLQIPPGSMVSYQDIAEYLSKPSAARAVGSAIANNPIGYLIPCHRVISKAGKAHRYRWGAERKQAILGWEASRLMGQTSS